MTEYYFRLGCVDDAGDLIAQFHYSRSFPAAVQVCASWHEPGGLFGDYGRAIAAVLFTIPPTRWSEDVWELARLVRRDDVKTQLSALIAKACDEIRRRHKQDLLVSFADPTHGHHGGVYQASGWRYAGRRDRAMDGLIVNGNFVPGRMCNNMFGTRSPDRLREAKPGWTIEPHFDAGKHLYWRPLNRKGEHKAQRLGLPTIPYPKPDREMNSGSSVGGSGK